MTKETKHRIKIPSESFVVVVITWESGLIEVYRKDSKELLEILIHEHENIYDVKEADMIV